MEHPEDVLGRLGATESTLVYGSEKFQYTGIFNLRGFAVVSKVEGLVVLVCNSIRTWNFLVSSDRELKVSCDTSVWAGFKITAPYGATIVAIVDDRYGNREEITNGRSDS